MALPNFNGTWTLTQSEYQQLKEDGEFLGHLRAVGVDNWEGYDTACQIYNGELNPEDI